MSALSNVGVERNTLVFFTSDNGGERFSYQWPFSGHKGELLEGGVRVPAIVRRPGAIPANGLTSQVAITMDWTATILAAAETNPHSDFQLDGENLLPVIRNTKPIYERTFFWRTREQDAVRVGKWKYFRDGEDSSLFDLSVDLREKADFKSRFPGVLSSLRTEFENWENRSCPALWISQRAPGTISTFRCLNLSNDPLAWKNASSSWGHCSSKRDRQNTCR